MVEISVSMKRESLVACAVVLAGGRGTRFWPRSRMRTPKQLLDITSSRSMLEETMARLRPMFSDRRAWVVTNEEQAAAVRRELPHVPRTNILAEPVGRNTAAAIGLAAVHLVHAHGDALMALLPADHHICDAARYRRILRAALEIARTAGNLVVLGIPPTRPDTGFGYIELGARDDRPGGIAAYAVRRFTEKPAVAVAKKYVASRRFLWNAGMFFWRASTFLDCLKQFLPKTHEPLVELAQTIGTRRYAGALRRIYPRLENISVDFAIMEPATRSSGLRRGQTKPGGGVFVLPAEVGWSDIGSWAAVYEQLAAKPGENISNGQYLALHASGNYLWSPGKFVAAVGVHDLVVVETPDALLICRRENSQDVGKIVKWLEERKLRHLL